MTRRRRGSIELRHGRWSLRWTDVNAGDGTVTRRRTRIDLGDVNTIRSEAAARRAADAWIARRHPDQLQQGEHLLAGAYFARFLEDEASNFRSSSRRSYTATVNTHLQPHLAGVPLASIDESAIRTLLSRLRSNGLSRGTVGKVRSILLQILRRARADGLDVRQIDRALVRLPREEVARREPRHITAEQLLRIIEASPSPWRELFALQGLAGLRISEALGLRWDDLDLTHGSAVMRVRQGAQGRELRPLKTATSRADVPLSDDLAGMLRVYQATWRPNDRQLLFATRTGMPIDAGYARRRHWQPLLQRLGIPSCGFHALRHGLPRRLFTAGVSANMVKALMRHGSLAVTERYSHHAAEDLRAAIHRVAQPRPAVTQAPATSRRFR